MKTVFYLEKALKKKAVKTQHKIYQEFFKELKEFLIKEHQNIIWRSNQTIGKREATELSIYKQEFIEKLLGIPKRKNIHYEFPDSI